MILDTGKWGCSQGVHGEPEVRGSPLIGDESSSRQLEVRSVGAALKIRSAAKYNINNGDVRKGYVSHKSLGAPDP